MSVTDLPGGLIATTDSTFAADVLGSDVPVLVDFWATWCGPCRMMAPVLAEIAREREGSLVVRKLDADENPETVRAYQVLSIPTMMLFHHGSPVLSMVGTRPKSRLLTEIDAALS